MNGKLAGKVASCALVVVIDSRGGAASSGTGRKSALSQHGSAGSIPDSGSKC